MKFFNSFPKILDNNNNYVTNLIVRTDLIPSLMDNTSLFYQYDMQDGDTPEIIANKYYGDPYRYWLFLYSNNIMDPQWDLALSDANFNIYLNSKYAEAAMAMDQSAIEYTQTTINGYYKTISTYDTISQTSSSNDYQIDYATYLITPEYESISTTLEDGSTVITTITTYSQTIYDHEIELNEIKRSVKILDSIHARDMENQLTSLLAS